mmetsp:Transcript_3915/g.9137  ORF Transcript_3915/g.9137 Transcript_3915/m.9137 type:complete len:251 (+) Transcript_3915:171-923(+)
MWHSRKLQYVPTMSSEAPAAKMWLSSGSGRAMAHSGKPCKQRGGVASKPKHLGRLGLARTWYKHCLFSPSKWHSRWVLSRRPAQHPSRRSTANPSIHCGGADSKQVRVYAVGVQPATASVQLCQQPMTVCCLAVRWRSRRSSRRIRNRLWPLPACQTGPWVPWTLADAAVSRNARSEWRAGTARRTPCSQQTKSRLSQMRQTRLSSSMVRWRQLTRSKGRRLAGLPAIRCRHRQQLFAVASRWGSLWHCG